MDYIKAAQDLGYEVELAWESPEERVYRVKGWGVDTMYSTKTNTDEWKFLVDPKAHEHRVNMWRHNLPTVAEALEGVEGDDFTMTEEEQYESALQASLSIGSITEEQASEMRESYKIT